LAEELGADPQTLRERVQALLDDGTLTRFGPMFDIERLGGAFTLAALSVPEDRFDAVAELLAAMPEVAHNYR
ncbi:MAG TPA: AsnC family protein, partial [Pseudomonas sp.]|nr:AsnC family protein [Pseudomonas sp.]